MTDHVRPFRNIASLSLWDFLAKACNFVAFVYLARVLGVQAYGTLEFGIASIGYFLLLADAGVEWWATREVAGGAEVRHLAGPVLTLRLLLATVAFLALIGLVLTLSLSHPLDVVLVLFGLTLFTQAGSLKWVLMGEQQLAKVGTGLALTQVAFAISVFGLVSEPEQVVWVPVLRLCGDVIGNIYYYRVFSQKYRTPRLTVSFSQVKHILQPALLIGLSIAFGLISFSFDSVMIGLLLGPAAVGLYGAAYRPLTVALAMPVTYFIGLFPLLARSHKEGRESFEAIVKRSLRLTAIVAIPFGIMGWFAAEPVVDLLFGPEYEKAAPVLQILGWSGIFVILRGTFKHGFNAVGAPLLDLRSGGLSAASNIILNLALIPVYGIIGAAIATVMAEIIWFALAGYYFRRQILDIPLASILWRPTVAACVMGGVLWVCQPLYWGLGMLIAVAVYVLCLLLLREEEMLRLAQGLRGTKRAWGSVLEATLSADRMTTEGEKISGARRQVVEKSRVLR